MKRTVIVLGGIMRSSTSCWLDLCATQAERLIHISHTWCRRHPGVAPSCQSNTGTSPQLPSPIADSCAMMPGTVKSMERMTSMGGVSGGAYFRVRDMQTSMAGLCPAHSEMVGRLAPEAISPKDSHRFAAMQGGARRFFVSSPSQQDSAFSTGCQATALIQPTQQETGHDALTNPRL